MKKKSVTRGGLWFVAPKPVEGDGTRGEATRDKPRRARRAKAKNDPRLVSAARELRDRWMERVNEDAPVLAGACKYDVARALPDAATTDAPAGARRVASRSLKQLPQAA